MLTLLLFVSVVFAAFPEENLKGDGSTSSVDTQSSSGDPCGVGSQDVQVMKYIYSQQNNVMRLYELGHCETVDGKNFKALPYSEKCYKRVFYDDSKCEQPSESAEEFVFLREVEKYSENIPDHIAHIYVSTVEHDTMDCSTLGNIKSLLWTEDCAPAETRGSNYHKLSMNNGVLIETFYEDDTCVNSTYFRTKQICNTCFEDAYEKEIEGDTMLMSQFVVCKDFEADPTLNEKQAVYGQIGNEVVVIDLHECVENKKTGKWEKAFPFNLNNVYIAYYSESGCVTETTREYVEITGLNYAETVSELPPAIAMTHDAENYLCEDANVVMYSLWTTDCNKEGSGKSSKLSLEGEMLVERYYNNEQCSGEPTKTYNRECGQCVNRKAPTTGEETGSDEEEEEKDESPYMQLTCLPPQQSSGDEGNGDENEPSKVPEGGDEDGNENKSSGVPAGGDEDESGNKSTDDGNSSTASTFIMMVVALVFFLF